MQCSNCREYSHNKRTCPKLPPRFPAPPATTATPPTARKRRKAAQAPDDTLPMDAAVATHSKKRSVLKNAARRYHKTGNVHAGKTGGQRTRELAQSASLLDVHEEDVHEETLPVAEALLRAHEEARVIARSSVCDSSDSDVDTAAQHNMAASSDEDADVVEDDSPPMEAAPTFTCRHVCEDNMRSMIVTCIAADGSLLGSWNDEDDTPDEKKHTLIMMSLGMDGLQGWSLPPASRHLCPLRHLYTMPCTQCHVPRTCLPPSTCRHLQKPPAATCACRHLCMLT